MTTGGEKIYDIKLKKEFNKNVRTDGVIIIPKIPVGDKIIKIKKNITIDLKYDAVNNIFTDANDNIYPSRVITDRFVSK